jgi:antitoxin component YwqK of YwqJK toxin-antitoxin module
MDFYKGIKETSFHISILFTLYLICHEINKYNDENDTQFVKETASYSAIPMGKCKISIYFSNFCDSQSQIFGYNLRNNVKRLTLRSHFINRHKL